MGSTYTSCINKKVGWFIYRLELEGEVTTETEGEA